MAVDGPFFTSDPDPELIADYQRPDPNNSGLYLNLLETAETLHYQTDYAVVLDLGIDALNPVQVSAANMAPERLRKEFGDRLAFWGGVDTQEVLPFNNPEAVCAEVRHLIDTVGSGYILAEVHNIQEHVLPGTVMTS